MSQNTLKVHDLNEDAEFDENGVERLLTKKP
ncbi:RNA polymerase sigma subunit RpoS (sigma-38) [Salmonella enterica subsp. enterica serovar Typhi]|nr:RNA polymerase sigma subunit RpoS (sigma-38) [Salmonella enterica subsp. enterica serovar Typhi]